MGTYIALHAIQVGTADDRRSIEPASQDGKHSGLFEHDFDSKTEKRLLASGSIRFPEGLEVHADPTEIEDLHDSRPIEGQFKTIDKGDAFKLSGGDAAAAAATLDGGAGNDTVDGGNDGAEDDLVGKTVPELKAVAEAETIDLGENTKKDDILSAIRAARVAKAEANGDEDLLS